MAFEVSGNLYRVAIGSEHDFIYVSAQDREDLIRYLAARYTRAQVFGAKIIGKDGFLKTVPVVTDPLFEKLISESVGAKQMPATSDFREVYLLTCTHQTKDGIAVFSSAHESHEIAEFYINMIKHISKYDPENVNELFNFSIHRDVIDVTGLQQLPSITGLSKESAVIAETPRMELQTDAASYNRKQHFTSAELNR